MFNKNIKIGFQSAVFHLCRRALVPLLRSDRGPERNGLCLGLGKTGKAFLITSVFPPILHSFFNPTRCYGVVKIIRLLRISN